MLLLCFAVSVLFCLLSVFVSALSPAECQLGYGSLTRRESSLFIHWYNNTALAESTANHQTYTTATYLSSLLISPTSRPSVLQPSPRVSAQVFGHLLIEQTGNYSFQCQYDQKGQHVLLWIDDHVVCPQDSNNVSLLIPIQAGQLLNVRLEYIQIVDINSNTPEISVSWSVNQHVNTTIPGRQLLACLTAARQGLNALRATQLVTSSWSTLSAYDYLTHTLLSHGFGLTISLYQWSTQLYQTGFYPQRRVDSSDIVQFEVGNRTFTGERDQPYTSLTLLWHGLPFKVESVGNGETDDLSLLLSLQSDSTIQVNLSDYLVVIQPTWLWDRSGQCLLSSQVQSNTSFATCTATGITPSLQLYSNLPAVSPELPGKNVPSTGSFAAFAFTPSSSQLVVTVGNQQRSVAEVNALLISATSRPGHRVSSLSADPAAIQRWIVQTTLSWLTVYTPYEGVVIIVSRSPSWNFGAAYVLFEWDTFFSVLMYAGYPNYAAKQLAVTSLIQMIKGKTINPDGLGFVPNYASGTKASRDRTEPPIGAKVLWTLIETYGSTDPELRWVTELVLDDLFTEHSWFFAHRRLEPGMLIALGSDPNQPTGGDIEVNDMQAARFESGLDNSPMYDDDPHNDNEMFNNITHLMQLYDVGMTSLYLAAAQSLVSVIDATGIRQEYRDILTARYAEMAPRTQALLWDDNAEIYVNKRPNNTFYYRLSPTSFYPMMVGLPSVTHAEQMVVRYLLNSSYFCVNSDCPYQGVPSISRSDKNYTDQSYWRGRVWGPHYQLVYWSLTHTKYAASVIIQSAIAQLVDKGTLLYQQEWEKFRHIHENYSGDNADGCNNGNADPFYSWGALAPYLAVEEQVRQTANIKHKEAQPRAGPTTKTHEAHTE